MYLVKKELLLFQQVANSFSREKCEYNKQENGSITYCLLESVHSATCVPHPEQNLRWKLTIGLILLLLLLFVCWRGSSSFRPNSCRVKTHRDDAAARPWQTEPELVSTERERETMDSSVLKNQVTYSNLKVGHSDTVRKMRSTFTEPPTTYPKDMRL